MKLRLQNTWQEAGQLESRKLGGFALDRKQAGRGRNRRFRFGRHLESKKTDIILLGRGY
jgi:hypothetical protein